MDAVIYKSIGGFYTVKTEDGVFIECKPRGIFRNRGQRLVAGDRVKMAMEADTWYIDQLCERKNEFVRPPVSNVDQVIIVASTVEPVPSLLVMDKLTVVAVDQQANPVIVVTKTDLASPEDIIEAYSTSGIQVILVNADTGAGIEQLRQLLKGKLSVLCGNSGVGKSTLLNALLPEAARQTSAISHKLGRGKHTTREVELFELAGGIIADTPGFASYDLQRASPIPSGNLQFCFPEIEKYITQCKYTGCSHVAEAGCAVKKAVQDGEIAKGRYESYIKLYEDAKESEKY